MDTSHPASPPPSGKDISQHSSTVHPPPPAAFPPAAHFRTGYNVGGKDPGGEYIDRFFILDKASSDRSNPAGVGHPPENPSPTVVQQGVGGGGGRPGTVHGRLKQKGMRGRNSPPLMGQLGSISG